MNENLIHLLVLYLSIMRKHIITLSLLVSTLCCGATNRITSIDINAVLKRDGSALITERWEVEQHDGTEFYLVKGNLGDIRISDLSVSEPQGVTYTNIGEWDSNLSFNRKAYKCGIIDIADDHKELCWGISSYGKHTYIVSYRLTNLVKSLNDYDMIHFQFISPKLSSAPEQVRLTLMLDSADFANRPPKNTTPTSIFIFIA